MAIVALRAFFCLSFKTTLFVTVVSTALVVALAVTSVPYSEAAIAVVNSVADVVIAVATNCIH